MGLTTRTSERTDATYLTIRTSTDAKGYKRAVLAKRVPEGTPGARQVFKADGMPALNKEGGTVWRLEYDELAGHIAAVQEHTADYGDGKTQQYMRLVITDGEAQYVLDLERGDRYWADVLMRLPNVDLADAVTIAPYNFLDIDNRPVVGVSLLQAGVKVMRAWSKATPAGEGPPQPTFDEDEQEWKWGKRNKWLEDNVLRPIGAKLG
jgi:hypothetical protein